MNNLIPLGGLTQSLAKKIGKGATVVLCKGWNRLTPHIFERTIWVIDKPKLLKDFAPDIKQLYYFHGAPMKDVAKLFNMSVSYAYKLLKQEVWQH